jgi:tetraacyldisaccharide-1-P 4'-kinase
MDREELSGQAVVVLTAIARPERFFNELKGLGATLVATHTFPDHHRFSPAELALPQADAARAGALLVTTAKDSERLDIPIWVAEQTVEILGGLEVIEATTRAP